jgi:transcriptional regulator with XRE-family HTH domain
VDAAFISSQEIRAGRKSLGLSQADLGERVDVHQVTISNWERGKSKPGPDQRSQLLKLFGGDVDTDSEPREEAYGDWVAETRRDRGLTRRELAARVGISYVQIRNIEIGQTLNPRPQTRNALEQVLGKAPASVVEAAEEAADISGVGRLTDFNPHDEDDFPSEPGVYVFYDISERPVYVGESGDIRKRIRGQDGHVDKFWYKSPIVETAAYVRVDDGKLRRQLEETLIKFLKSNAVINKKGVDRS